MVDFFQLNPPSGRGPFDGTSPLVPPGFTELTTSYSSIYEYDNEGFTRITQIADSAEYAPFRTNTSNKSGKYFVECEIIQRVDRIKGLIGWIRQSQIETLSNTFDDITYTGMPFSLLGASDDGIFVSRGANDDFTIISPIQLEAGDFVAMALNLNAPIVTYYVNGDEIFTENIITAFEDIYVFGCLGNLTGNEIRFNFGQRSFVQPIPAGFTRRW
ncbi:MAG: hypothetical protein WC284_16215 [Candidimonas sp.]